jgi:xylulose-5-phosphate/fructose-6-phosphate phosphoketolase
VRDWVWPDAGQTATDAAGPMYDAATATGGDNE